MKAVIYARYSSDNQRDESIDAQVRAIKEYAVINNISIVDIYSDEARSATTDKRPDFLRMMKDSELAQFNLVLVHKLDRFSRNRYDSAFYKNLLKLNGVKVVSVLEPLDDSPESVILESVLEGMSEYYSKNLSREVMKGMRETALKCKHTGGVPPLGYDVNPDKTYSINILESKAVKLIFEMYASGIGYSKIIDELNRLGYQTKRGNSFGNNSIHDLLKNEKYIGTYIFNRTERKTNGKRNGHRIKDDSEIIKIPNGMPQIIEKELFEKIKIKMEENKNGPGRFQTKENYLLSGLIYCGDCGGKMTGKRRYAGRKHNLYLTYECSTRKRNKTCSMKSINKKYIEDLVIEQLESDIFNPKAMDQLIKKLVAYSKKQLKSVDNDLKVLRIELNQLNGKINNIVEAIANGMFHESMKKKLATLETQKSNLEKNIEKIQLRSQSITYSKKEMYDYFKKDADIKQRSPEDQKEIIQAYVKKIEVFENTINIENIVTFIGGGGGSRTRFDVFIPMYNVV
jgi:site-specific DNA recombinase